MRQRAAIPVQRALHVRPGTDILENAIIAVDQPEVEPVGMSVTSPRVPVVQCDVHAPIIATHHPEALSLEEGRARRRDGRLGNDGTCEEQRFPSEIGPAEGRARDVALGLGRRTPTCAVPRWGVGVELRQAACQFRGTRRPRQTQLQRLGDAPLPQRRPVLRITPGREGVVRQRGQQGRHKASIEPAEEFLPHGMPRAFRKHNEIPEPPVREKVVVLALVPGAVGEQRGAKALVEATGPRQRAVHQFAPVEQESGRRQGRAVPHLAVAESFVEFPDQPTRRVENLTPHRAAQRCAATVFEEPHGDRQLQRPDRFEVGAEEHPGRSEDVILVRVCQVPVDEAEEDGLGHASVASRPGQARQHAGMNGAFGEPELVAHDPPAVMGFVIEDRPASGAAVAPRTARIEFEEGAVPLTPSALPGHSRLVGRNEDGLVRQQPVQVRRQRVSQRRQRTRGDGRALLH